MQSPNPPVKVGSRISVSGHPRKRYNGTWQVTSIRPGHACTYIYLLRVGKSGHTLQDTKRHHNQTTAQGLVADLAGGYAALVDEGRSFLIGSDAA